MQSQITSNERFARPVSGPVVTRVIQTRIDYATLEELTESEREFYCEAREKVRALEEAREQAAVRRQRDDEMIEDLANAFLDLGDMNPAKFQGISDIQLAVGAELEPKFAKRLRRDAIWLARDMVETERLRGLNDRTPDQERELAMRLSESNSQRDLRIAYEALASGTVKTRRLTPHEKHYSPRQLQLVRADTDREAYLRRMADERRGHSHIIERDDADGIVGAHHQSASDRFDPGGRGYVGEAGYVGGSSTQENGGSCWQNAFVEKGKRSSASVLDQRYVAATPKAPGKRRKGISSKKVLQRIEYLDGIGKSLKEIADDNIVRDTVSRVKGALFTLRNDTRHWTGDNNDRRHVHQAKWVALDQIHGNTRTDCREIIRVDKDMVFESWDECNAYVNTLKVRPQKINYVRDDEFPERVTRPHFVHYLPAGRGVWYDEPTGMAMLEAIAAALTIDAGGDIGGLANIGDCKQPTSPRVVSIEVEDAPLYDLSELCKILNVDLKNNLAVTMRQQSVAQMEVAGISKKQSGLIYSLAWKRGIELCMLWESTKQLRVDAGLDRRILGEQIAEAVFEDRIMADHLNQLRTSARDAAENSIRVAAKKAAESYGKGRRASSRGYDLRAAEDEVAEKVSEVRANAPAGLTPAEIKKLEIRAAQVAGREYCNRTQVERSVRRISDAMLEISRTGVVPDDKAVTKLTGMDIRTVRNRWEAAVALNAANAIVAVVLDAPPTVPEPEKGPDTTSAPAPAKCSSVRGVARTDSGEEQPGQPTVATIKGTGSAPVLTLTLATVIPATMLPLVNALRPGNPASGAPQTGIALLEFCRPGVTLYRSTVGIREQERLRSKGRRLLTTNPDNRS